MLGNIMGSFHGDGHQWEKQNHPNQLQSKKKAHTTEVKKHKVANDQVPTAKKIQDIMSF